MKKKLEYTARIFLCRVHKLIPVSIYSRNKNRRLTKIHRTFVGLVLYLVYECLFEVRYFHYFF